MKKNKTPNKLLKFNITANDVCLTKPNVGYVVWLDITGNVHVITYDYDENVINVITQLIEEHDDFQKIKYVIENQYDVTNIVRWDYKECYNIDFKKYERTK